MKPSEVSRVDLGYCHVLFKEEYDNRGWKIPGLYSERNEVKRTARTHPVRARTVSSTMSGTDDCGNISMNFFGELSDAFVMPVLLQIIKKL